MSLTLEKLVDAAFNTKLATYSAIGNGIVTGAVAWLDNTEYGAGIATKALAYQAGISFLFTGFTGRLVQWFSPIKDDFISYVGGSVIPAMTTGAIAYGVHSYIADTPDKWATIGMTTALSLLTSPITNYWTKTNKFNIRPKYYPHSFR